VFIAETFPNRAGDGFQMRIGRSRANDKKIGERGNATEIENDKVLGFFIGGETGAGAGELFGGKFNGVGFGRDGAGG